MDSGSKNRHDAAEISKLNATIRRNAAARRAGCGRQPMACVLRDDRIDAAVSQPGATAMANIGVAFMRNFAVSAAAAALLAAGTPAAFAAEAVTFQTNWLAQAEHGGYYQAVADGTYAACGLDVTIQMGGPQVSGRPLLLAGKIDFYMGGNMLQAFSAVEQEIPLRIVAASFQKEPQVLMSHPGQGLDTWESLKDAEQYILSDEGFQSYFQWMVTELGYDPAKRVPYTFNPAPFIANPKSVQQGYVTSEPYAVEKEGGFKPNLFLLADYGFDTYATTIETMQKTIDERPKVVECFVDGSAKGWYNYLYGDNKAANEMIKKDNPDITDEQIAFSIEKMKEFGIVDSGDTEKLGIGAMTDARIKSFYDKMVKAKVVKDGLDISKAYTLEFVNKGVGLDLKK
jgi:NitT/TauT family transport system substrate-binding protein